MTSRTDLQRRLMVWRRRSTPSSTPSLLSCSHAYLHSLRPLQHNHRHHDVHDVFCFRADKRLVLLLLLQLLLLLPLTSARTTTTRVITRRRWNNKRPMNSQLDVHVPTFATVDTNHPLRYAMMNMCLNLN